MLPDNVLSDETNLTRFFLETLDHHFSVTLDSTFSVNGTMSLSDIVKDNFFEFSLVAQGFRVTLSPDVISGVVQYAVPVPLPATLGMGLAGLAVLGGAAATVARPPNDDLILSRADRRGGDDVRRDKSKEAPAGPLFVFRFHCARLYRTRFRAGRDRIRRSAAAR